MGRFIRSIWLVPVVALAACAGKSGPARTTPDNPAVLEVENRGFADMVIYAISGSQRLRLGLATGNSTKSFTIPNSILRGAGTLRFLADPVGGTRTPVSDELSVEPGEVVTLTIPP
jgi:hypothetical protein